MAQDEEPSAASEAADGGAADAAPAAEPEPAADAAPAAAESSSPLLRISAGGGLGEVSEPQSGTSSLLSLVDADLSLFLVPGLDLGIGTEASFYRRSYLLTLPDAQGRPGGVAVVDETRLRSTLHVGYDVLDGPGIGGGNVGLIVAFRGAVDSFMNDVVPVTAIALGGELRFWARPADEFVVEAYGSWLGAAWSGDETVVARMAYGGEVSDLRFGAGGALVLAPRVRVRLAYQGGWLALAHAERFSHAVNLGLSIDL